MQERSGSDQRGSLQTGRDLQNITGFREGQTVNGGRGWEFADRERSTEHHGVQGRSGSKQRESLLTG